jgi:hypothetical protein
VQAGDQPQRLFLQQVAPHSAIVKWRGGDATRVCFSTKLSDLEKRNWPRCVDGIEEDIPDYDNHRQALLTGLAPNQTYYYALGSIRGEDYQFRTPPNSNKPPRDGNTRIWMVGDSGTATELNSAGLPRYPGQALAVATGFEKFVAATGGEPADLFVLLGDNAYATGTDQHWQGAFFDIYTSLLKRTPALPTIGNHEMGNGALPCQFIGACGSNPPGTLVPLAGTSVSSDPSSYSGDSNLSPDAGGMPYLNIFSLPIGAESGGVASGTEQYYSVDYGNVHIVSLDTQLSARDASQRAAMMDWLLADLGSNSRDWTVVIFHHPPYTKGANHDSDRANGGLGIDQPQWDMRVEFTPIFEEYGVDVVYSGHSHSYERSYYLQGSRDVSTPSDPILYAELDAAGQPVRGYGDQSYQQISPTSGYVDDRVVYTVAGSSGKFDTNQGAVTPAAEWMRHPVHVPQPADSLCTAAPDDGFAGCRNGLLVLGSVVLDASATRLTSRFIDINGNVLDEFTIER